MILRKEPCGILGSGPRARRGGSWAQGQRKGLVGPGPRRASSARTLRGAVSGRNTAQGLGMAAEVQRVQGRRRA